MVGSGSGMPSGLVGDAVCRDITFVQMIEMDCVFDVDIRVEMDAIDVLYEYSLLFNIIQVMILGR